MTTSRHSIARIALFALSISTLACVGSLDAGPGGAEVRTPVPGGALACTGLCVTASRTARVTTSEYANSVVDVFGFAPDTSALPTDGAVNGFASNEFVEFGESDADRYELAAVRAASDVVNGTTSEGQRRLDVLLASTPECGTRNEACAFALIDHWGASLYRRTLTAEEQASLRGIFGWATRPGTAPEYADGLGGNFEDGMRLVVSALLQSPAYLYRIEHGVPTATPGVVRLTSNEVAARLAAFLWRSVPDATLRAAAQRNELDTTENIQAQARRMLADPRSERFWLQFTEEWLHISRLDAVSVGTPPEGEAWNPQVITALRNDLAAFVLNVVRDGDGRLSTLLTSQGGALTDRAAAWVVGTNTPGWNDAIDHRHGLLTLPAVLIANGSASFSRAHWRGLFVRDQILCQTVPAPSPEVSAAIASIRAAEENHPSAFTYRARLQAVTGNAACATCHSLTNPIGYGLDSFDAFARFRTTELGTDGVSYALDTSGELTGRGALRTDVDGAFANTDELIEKLASSRTVDRCATLQLARFALRRDASEWEDNAAVEAAMERFHATGGDLREVVVAITTTDAFRHRSIAE